MSKSQPPSKTPSPPPPQSQSQTPLPPSPPAQSQSQTPLPPSPPPQSQALVIVKCRACSMSDQNDCQGCILARHFNTDEEMDTLPLLFLHYGVGPFRTKLEMIESTFGSQAVKFYIQEMVECIKTSNEHISRITSQLTQTFAESTLCMENELRIKDRRISYLRSESSAPAPGSSTLVAGSPSLTVDLAPHWEDRRRSIRGPRKYYLEDETDTTIDDDDQGDDPDYRPSPSPNYFLESKKFRGKAKRSAAAVDAKPGKDKTPSTAKKNARPKGASSSSKTAPSPAEDEQRKAVTTQAVSQLKARFKYKELKESPLNPAASGSKRAHTSKPAAWTIKEANNGPAAFGELEIYDDKDDDEEGPRGVDLDLNAHAFEKGVDWEHEEIFTDDGGVNAGNDPEEMEDLATEIPAPPEIKQVSKSAGTKRKVEGDESKPTSGAPLKKVKTETDAKPGKDKTPSTAKKNARPKGASSSSKTAPSPAEDEQRKAVTTPAVSQLKARFKYKELKESPLNPAASGSKRAHTSKPAAWTIKEANNGPAAFGELEIYDDKDDDEEGPRGVDLDLNAHAFEKGVDWEHEEIFTDDGGVNAGNDPEEMGDLTTEIPVETDDGENTGNDPEDMEDLTTEIPVEDLTTEIPASPEIKQDAKSWKDRTFKWCIIS